MRAVFGFLAAILAAVVWVIIAAQVGIDNDFIVVIVAALVAAGAYSAVAASGKKKGS